jgi:hypothetical protein
MMKQILLLLFLGATAVASESPKDSSAQASQTSHSFEDLLVQGKYHFADEAVSTVEEDKVLDSLLGVRSDFKDRMTKSAEQF